MEWRQLPIILTGSLTRNLLGEIHWRGVPESGVLVVDAPAESCRIAFFQVKTATGTGHRFAGKTASGRGLSDEECRALLKLPVLRWQPQGEIIGEYNRHQHKSVPDALDSLLKTDEPDPEAAAKQKQAFALRRRELEKQLEAAQKREAAAAQALENAANRMEKLRLQRDHVTAIRTCKEAERRLFLCVPEPIPCKAPAEAVRLFTLKISGNNMKDRRI